MLEHYCLSSESKHREAQPIETEKMCIINSLLLQKWVYFSGFVALRICEFLKFSQQALL